MRIIKKSRDMMCFKCKLEHKKYILHIISDIIKMNSDCTGDSIENVGAIYFMESPDNITTFCLEFGADNIENIPFEYVRFPKETKTTLMDGCLIFDNEYAVNFVCPEALLSETQIKLMISNN